MSDKPKKQIYFGDFRVFVIEHIKIIEQRDFETYSTEWFLLKYLKRIIKTTEDSANPGRVEGSMRSLMRFYVDNIDKKSELEDQCIKIYDQYRKTLRTHQTEQAK